MRGWWGRAGHRFAATGRAFRAAALATRPALLGTLGQETVAAVLVRLAGPPAPPRAEVVALHDYVGTYVQEPGSGEPHVITAVDDGLRVVAWGEYSDHEPAGYGAKDVAFSGAVDVDVLAAVNHRGEIMRFVRDEAGVPRVLLLEDWGGGGTPPFYRR